MKIKWLYASSYSIFVIINSILKSINLTNLTFQVGYNSFTENKLDPDDRGYLPCIKYTFREKISWNQMLELKRKFTDPSMNMKVLHESYQNDKGLLTLAHINKNIDIIINNSCLRWISKSFFGNSENSNDPKPYYEYNQVKKAIQKYI